jgi:hypothetical protein
LSDTHHPTHHRKNAWMVWTGSARAGPVLFFMPFMSIVLPMPVVALVRPDIRPPPGWVLHWQDDLRGGKGAAAGYSRAQLRGLLPTGPLYRLLHRLHSRASPPRIHWQRGRTHCPSRPPLFAGAGRDGPLGMHAWARGSSAQGSNRVQICNLSPFPLS